MKKIIKKYSLIIALVLLIVIGAAAGISYAVFSNTASQTTTNTMSALNCLNITFTSNTDSVSLANTYPMTAAEGLATTPYNFTIKNNCSNYVEYYLLANVINNASIANGSYIKVNLSGYKSLDPTVITSLQTYTTPSDLSNVLTTYVLVKSGLDDNESQTYDYRMWLDGDNASIWTDETIENKNYTVKLSVVGIVKTNANHIVINLPASPVGVYSTAFTGTTWNNKTASLEVSSIQNKGKNIVNLTNADTSSATNFASYIIGLSGSTQGTGQVVNENGYRYEGKDPNNYVSFNGELWRIIGVFDANTHGIASTNLVKIIRNEPIGSYVWDKNDTNDWPNSSMYHLLNDYYYNGTNETTPTYCYGYSTSVPAHCDFTYNGITNSTYRSMIQNVTWHLGGMTSADTPSAVYTAERGTTVYSGRSATSTGNIGLMYLSDYGYSVLASSCARTTNISSYNSSACASENWLYTSDYVWTITPNSSYATYVWNVNTFGYAGSSHAYNARGASSVLYLNSSVKVYGGDGSKNNPYILVQ